MTPLEQVKETKTHIIYEATFDGHIIINVHSPIDGSPTIDIFANGRLVGKLITHQVAEAAENGETTLQEEVEDLLWRANVGR